MTRLYRFLDIYENEVCINPNHISSIHQSDGPSGQYLIEMSNGRTFKIKGDINIISNAIEMTANNINNG